MTQMTIRRIDETIRNGLVEMEIAVKVDICKFVTVSAREAEDGAMEIHHCTCGFWEVSHGDCDHKRFVVATMNAEYAAQVAAA